MLTENLTIKNIILKNRIIAAPMVTNYWDDHGNPTAKTLELYEGYANSGTGLVVAEQLIVHPWGRSALKQPSLYDDDSALALRELTKIFREKEIPVVAQLNFSSRVITPALLDTPNFKFVSPSGLPTPRKSNVDAESCALELSEIDEIIKAFADAARRAVEISMFNGGVQIYASHGYLISQFLSPLTNVRTDAYGGSLGNRSRLLFEIVKTVKKAIGDVPLSVRLGASDQMPGELENGLTLKESIWVAEELSKMGIDWLSVSGNHCIYGIGVNDDDTAYFAPYSKAMRDVVHKHNVLVDCTGGIRSREKAEKLLEGCICDLIGIGRPLASNKSFLEGWHL
ncbi:oxidoreductase [Fusibacter ferrireducens]|uniref:NADH:flavin oxidoreductase n=1 Tax=Fusibacter ferrireducens TaxID=2785058 RepID=A0ABR9ZWD8_9FIRM|nr:NADH:flavin oxidoreductase [Fusibacter ferrireducens]MBF4694766.1 NADH:flavin oxidoreductase [Fusibacter ferrireducens]